jgi:hypothetical protein
MLAFQLLSLMYRYAVIHENREVYNLFMSKKVQFGLIMLCQVIAIGLSSGFYAAILGPDVSFIKNYN